jgi:adenine deaminase
MIDDKLKVYNTWLGGKLVVENKKITSILDEQLSKNKYIYPKKAYQTIKLPNKIKLIPSIPNKEKLRINVLKTELQGILTTKETIIIEKRINNWSEVIEKHNLCHLCVIERYGKNGEYAHGFVKNFNLKSGAVASSVGHDAHNIIVAGLNKNDMQLAIEIIKKSQGAIVITNNGKLIAKVDLPIAGLLSDKKAFEVAKENEIFKKLWSKSGCTLAYMGFNLLTLSVIPNFRLTNKGLVDVNTMSIVPLFE